jgi:hypothetical protein
MLERANLNTKTSLNEMLERDPASAGLGFACRPGRCVSAWNDVMILFSRERRERCVQIERARPDVGLGHSDAGAPDIATPTSPQPLAEVESALAWAAPFVFLSHSGADTESARELKRRRAFAPDQARRAEATDLGGASVGLAKSSNGAWPIDAPCNSGMLVLCVKRK